MPGSRRSDMNEVLPLSSQKVFGLSGYKRRYLRGTGKEEGEQRQGIRCDRESNLNHCTDRMLSNTLPSLLIGGNNISSSFWRNMQHPFACYLFCVSFFRSLVCERVGEKAREGPSLLSHATRTWGASRLDQVGRGDHTSWLQTAQPCILHPSLTPFLFCTYPFWFCCHFSASLHWAFLVLSKRRV